MLLLERSCLNLSVCCGYRRSTPSNHRLARPSRSCKSGAYRFRRMGERRIILIDQDGRDDGRDNAFAAAAAQLVHERLGDHKAHAALDVCDGDFHGKWVYYTCGGLVAQQEIADLLAVAVRDDELMAILHQVRERSSRYARVGELLIYTAVFVRAGDGVPAEGNDDQ